MIRNAIVMLHLFKVEQVSNGNQYIKQKVPFVYTVEEQKDQSGMRIALMHFGIKEEEH
jgi:hypothetical protein